MINLTKPQPYSQGEIYPQINPRSEIEIYPNSANTQPESKNSLEIIPAVNYPFFQAKVTTSNLVVTPITRRKISNAFISNVRKTHRFLNGISIHQPALTFFKFIGSFDQLKSFLTTNYPKLKFVPRTVVFRYPHAAEISYEKDIAFLNTQGRFLVAIDHKEYIYIDALSSYCRLIDDFYENN